ncbi:MAG TPA: hypothetical protein VE967_02485 [Gemmatimonadaceae bacterium]|nr:hypothetical protein [Gemmatimonadaceae bacterium]
MRTIVLGMAVLGLPLALTLLTIKAPMHADGANDSPYGYTVSLLIFLVPVLAIGFKHITGPAHPANKRGLIGAAAAIAVLGFLLDLFFGYEFFSFTNPGATIGVRLPAFDVATFHWMPSYLPIEEFGFYILGGLFLVTLYMWFDQRWLFAYTADEYGDRARAKEKLIELSPSAILLWALLVVAGFLYKKYTAEPGTEGFPGYFVFLMTLGLLPTFLCVKGIAEFVNWRAFACSSLVMILLSIVWEASLGVPFDWWNYRHEHMIGISVRAWGDLPLEAVLLWIMSAWLSLIAFEFFRAYAHMNRRPTRALFGHRAGDATHPGAGPAA